MRNITKTSITQRADKPFSHSITIKRAYANSTYLHALLTPGWGNYFVSKRTTIGDTGGLSQLDKDLVREVDICLEKNGISLGSKIKSVAELKKAVAEKQVPAEILTLIGQYYTQATRSVAINTCVTALEQFTRPLHTLDLFNGNLLIAESSTERSHALHIDITKKTVRLVCESSFLGLKTGDDEYLRAFTGKIQVISELTKTGLRLDKFRFGGTEAFNELMKLLLNERQDDSHDPLLSRKRFEKLLGLIIKHEPEQYACSYHLMLSCLKRGYYRPLFAMNDNKVSAIQQLVTGGKSAVTDAELAELRSHITLCIHSLMNAWKSLPPTFHLITFIFLIVGIAAITLFLVQPALFAVMIPVLGELGTQLTLLIGGSTLITASVLINSLCPIVSLTGLFKLLNGNVATAATDFKTPRSTVSSSSCGSSSKTTTVRVERFTLPAAAAKRSKMSKFAPPPELSGSVTHRLGSPSLF